MYRPLDILNKWWNVKNSSDMHQTASLLINSNKVDVSVYVVGSYTAQRIYNGQSYFEKFIGDWSTPNVLYHDPGTPILINVTGKTTAFALFSQRLTEMQAAGSIIRDIDCNNNSLTELDVSLCRKLRILKVGRNPFLQDETQAINFANNLPSFTSGQHELRINGGSPYYAQIKTIAEAKGWAVYDS